ncbi:MAG: hypothetical protein RugAbin2_01458 [Rugosibacter sp.]|jgi:hypothetical protein|nr:hypothetical protein [Rugosibacter sp.]
MDTAVTLRIYEPENFLKTSKTLKAINVRNLNHLFETFAPSIRLPWMSLYAARLSRNLQKKYFDANFDY